MIPHQNVTREEELRLERFLKKLIQWFGWLGVAALLVAYGLISNGVIDNGRIFQTLNLFGAFGLGLTAWDTGNRQSLVVQIVWGLIAAIAITRLSL